MEPCLLVATIEKHPMMYYTSIQVHETIVNCTMYTMVPLHLAFASPFTFEPPIAFPTSS
jgi:hypothetical protein